jgi:hypothetical protein
MPSEEMRNVNKHTTAERFSSTPKLSSRGSLTILVALANRTRLPRSAAALC